MLFMRNPAIVEAMQFETNNEEGSPKMDELVKWIVDNGGCAVHDGTDIHICTPNGRKTAVVGDWIIKDVKGEFDISFRICKPDGFALAYKRL